MTKPDNIKACRASKKSKLPGLIAGVAAAVTILSGCASSGFSTDRAALLSDRDPLAPVPELERRDVDPALWVLEDDDTQIYLFGTVHYLPPGLNWFDEEVRAAFDRSEAVVLEMVSPPSSELLQLMLDRGLAADGIVLRDRLNEEDRKSYEALMRRLDLSVSAFDSYEPWLAFMTLYQLVLRDGGLDPNEGVEKSLTAVARQKAKPILGLETAAEQLDMFDNLSEPEQLEMLRSVIADPDKAADQIQDIVRFWSEGDISGLDRFLLSTEDSAETEAVLFTRRNENWADWIESRMDEPGTIFIAVGAAHLAGNNDVIEMLKNRSLNVRRVEY